MAHGLYQDALDCLEKCEDKTDEVKKLQVACLQNMGVALNNLGDY